MKVLMIGMDGAHIDVFKRGWTPYISSLIEKGNQLNIKNDLISRGWLEIATGEHSSITGAMYDKPKADGTLDFNDEFSIKNIPGLGTKVKPIWQKLNEAGYSVGVMNLPTVFPSPKVNGFFVSGGGGGAPVVEKATLELCYPKEILKVLTKHDYIVDERIPQLVVEKKLNTVEQIFIELAKKNNKRTSSFIELANSYNIDFGFVIYKTSSVTAETVLVPEFQKLENGDNSVNNETIKAMKNYYEKFDKEIETLHKAFPSTELIFVSDHGSIARTHSINPNLFLQEEGFQKVKISKNIKKSIVNKLKNILPFSVKMALKKISAVKKSVATVSNFDSETTLAFCRTKNDWNHGIFINDKKRFNGPVETTDIEKIKNEIIEKFNNHPAVKEHNIIAYSIKNENSNLLETFPDIVLDLPNGYLTNDSIKEFIKDFKVIENVDSLSAILRGDIFSIKSHSPLAVDCGKNSEENKKLYNGRNLTAMYDLVLRKFNEHR